MKIVQEKESLHPDYGLITHWQVEIDAFRNSLERTLKRIG